MFNQTNIKEKKCKMNKTLLVYLPYILMDFIVANSNKVVIRSDWL